MSQPALPGYLHHADPELSERHRAVFEALVLLHGRTARPVGSDAVTAAARLGLSAASVRGALAELEGLGLVEKTRASGGRVPTPTGYGYYVRKLTTPAALPAETLEAMDRVLRDSAEDVERLLHEASRLLSSLTRQMGLALAASLDQETLVRLDLTPVEGRRALLVLALGDARVRTLVLELESPLAAGELGKVAETLRERLVGRRLADVRRHLERDSELIRSSAIRIVAHAACRSWADPVSTPLYSAGAQHMSEHPEFASAPRLGSVLHAVESGTSFHRLMVGAHEGATAVRVGLDEDQALARCSLVTYSLPGSVSGAVAVLGPLRMDYAHALAVVDAVGSRVADLLQS